MSRAGTRLVILGGACVLLLAALGSRMGGIPPIGALLDPANGLYRTARSADRSIPTNLSLPGLSGDVRVIWDERRVPHIYASNSFDAVTVLGYVEARDRLFQIDFIGRAASGRLAEAMGPAALPADRFLRATGMEWGARKNLERIERQDGVELDVLEAYCRGVNAYLDELSRADLPFEFRLLGYTPDPCTPIQPLRVLQYMNYDLSYETDEAGYGWLRDRLTDADYRLLYPEHPDYSVPMIPPTAHEAETSNRNIFSGTTALSGAAVDLRHTALSSLLEAYFPGKGSNNWAVSGERSSTGRPILAGDMHLSVSLPAIWYEAHIVTPELNVYGVSIPGAPLPVEAFNEHLGWAFTNTGSDQIDQYLMEVDSTETRYRFEGTWRNLEAVVDTIYVNGGSPVIDTLRFSHWGPVTRRAGDWIAQQWVAHDTSRTLHAVWNMMHARDHGEFQEALRSWDTPMQNILYADRYGTISLRSTGFMPVRRDGGGAGLRDGAAADGEWIGRIPFDELPYGSNPAQGFLTSTNQKPTDSTYAHYLGHDWGGRTYRSIRIDALLRGKPLHSVDDIQRYQSDVYVVQRDFFAPLLDTLSGLTGRADSLRSILVSWDGEASVDHTQPIAFYYLLDALAEMAWDEAEFDPVTKDASGTPLARPLSVPRPAETRIYHLLATRPGSRWLDIVSTPQQETAADLLRVVLDSTAARLASDFGWSTDAWRWGERHGIRFNHSIGALTALGRGPYEYPGFAQTLSPAGGTVTTHSASWRVVVDFSTTPPTGYGVYPGGQSGNPFSRYYDLHLPMYLDFQYFDLINSREPDGIEPVLGRTTFHPSAE